MGKLRSGTFIHEVSEGRIQVGSNPEHAIVFSDVTAEEKLWLYSLREGVTPRGRDASRLSNRQKDILKLLKAASLLKPVPKPLSRLRIRIEGLDRVGVSLATTLAQEGARHLDLRDSERVNLEVEHIFPKDSKGLRRAESLQRTLSEHKDLRLGRITYPDVVVTCTKHVWDHAQAGLLLGSDINHLPIVSEDRAIRVGPFISPGLTACAVCVDMHVRDVNPDWPDIHLALQNAEPVIPSNHMAGAAAGLALTMIESVALGISLRPESSPQADSRRSRLQQSPSGPLALNQVAPSHSWRITHRGVETSTWLPHPDCGCLNLVAGAESVAS